MRTLAEVATQWHTLRSGTISRSTLRGYTTEEGEIRAAALSSYVSIRPPDTEEEVRTLLKWELWLQLVHPAKREFFHACQAAIGDPASLDAWLDPKNDITREVLHFADDTFGDSVFGMFRAHLLCAKAISEHGKGFRDHDPELLDALRVIAEQTEQPLPFVYDLARTYRPTGVPRSGLREVVATGLLVEKSSERSGPSEPSAGAAANLRLVLLPALPYSASGRQPPAGVLYPSPELAFVIRDPDFLESEEEACAYVRDTERLWSAAYDVRWHLERRDHVPFFSISGPSLGFAFSIGLAKLLASAP